MPLVRSRTAPTWRPTTELPAARPDVARAFSALLWRDVFVTGREAVPFLLQVVLQPVFLLFVFGKVLAVGVDGVGEAS